MNAAKVRKPKRNQKVRSFSTNEDELKISIAEEEAQQRPRQMSSNDMKKDNKSQNIPDSSSQKEYSHYLAELLSKHREKSKQQQTQHKASSSSSSLLPLPSSNERAQTPMKQQQLQQQNQSQKLNSKKQIKNNVSQMEQPEASSTKQIKIASKSSNQNAKSFNDDAASQHSSKKDSVASFQTGCFAMESKETQPSPGSMRGSPRNRSMDLDIFGQKSTNRMHEDSSIPSGILQNIHESIIRIPKNSIRISSARLQSRIPNQTNLTAQSITLSPRSHTQNDCPLEQQSSVPNKTHSSLSIQTQKNLNKNIQNLKNMNENSICLEADKNQSQSTLNTRIRSGVNRVKSIEQSNSNSNTNNGVFRIKSTKNNNSSLINSQGNDKRYLNSSAKVELSSHNSTNNQVLFPLHTPILHPGHKASSENQPFSNYLLKSSSVEITSGQEFQQQQPFTVQKHKRNASSFQKRFDSEGNTEKDQEIDRYLVRANTAKFNSQLNRNNLKPNNNTINSIVNSSSNQRSLSQASDYKYSIADNVQNHVSQSKQLKTMPSSRLSADNSLSHKNTNILTTSLPHLDGVGPPQLITKTEGDQVYYNDRYSYHNTHLNSKYQMQKNWITKSSNKDNSSDRTIEKCTGVQSWPDEDNEEEEKEGKYGSLANINGVSDKKRISIKFEDISSKKSFSNVKHTRSNIIDEASGSAEMSSKNSQCYSDYVRSIYDSNMKKPLESFKIQQNQKNGSSNSYHGSKNSHKLQQNQHESEQMFQSQQQDDDKRMANISTTTNDIFQKAVNLQKIDMLEQLSSNLSLSQQKYQQNQVQYQYKQPAQMEQARQPYQKQYQKYIPQQFLSEENYQGDQQLGEIQGHNQQQYQLQYGYGQQQQQLNKLKISLPASNQPLKCFFNSSLQQCFLDRPLAEFQDNSKQFNDQNLQSNWSSNLQRISDANNNGHYQSISSFNRYDNNNASPLRNIRSISTNGDYYKGHNSNNQYLSLDQLPSNNNNPRDISNIRRQQLFQNPQYNQHIPLSCFENSLITYNNHQPLFNPSIQSKQTHENNHKAGHQLYASYSASKQLNSNVALEKATLSTAKSKFPRDIFTPNVKSMRKKLSQPL